MSNSRIEFAISSPGIYQMQTQRLRLLLAIILLHAHLASAQEYYSVSDQDGYSNMRDAPGTGATIVKQVNSGHCVVGLFKKNAWTKVIVYFSNDRVQISGFIHSSKLKKDNECKDDPSVRSIPVGDFALEGLDFSQGFEETALWFKEYRQYIFDDGYYSEGYSAYVMGTLARSFNSSVAFISTAKIRDPAFANFILRHIDATGSTSDLQAILKQARKCVAQEVCEQIATKAKQAIDEI